MQRKFSVGINLAVEAIIGELKKMSKKIDSSKEIAQVGTCSANQDEVIGQDDRLTQWTRSAKMA